jgi:hypothetical protein
MTPHGLGGKEKVPSRPYEEGEEGFLIMKTIVLGSPDVATGTILCSRQVACL